MRRRKAEKRQTIPDIRFNDIIIARLINTVMERGKKTVAQGIVYGAMDILKEKKADMEPLEVPAERQTAVALRWIVGYSRARKGVPMAKALAAELLDAFDNTGNAVKKKDDTHKMANANKAFAHYRW